MSSYTRGGNELSLFVQELNTIPASEPAEDYSAMEPENFELFTNTNFFDFDTGTQTDFRPDESTSSTKPDKPASSTRMVDELGMVNYVDSTPSSATGELNFDFHSYVSPIDSNFHSGIGYQGSSQAAYPPLSALHGPQHPPYSNRGVTEAHRASDKRRPPEPHVSSRLTSIEDVSRAAAEEDKRRRNTAASARFRVKKKQREQALEKSAKEMTDRVQALESKITQLETENVWLKKLVLEKHDGTSTTAKEDKPKSTSDGTKDVMEVKTSNIKDAKKDA